MRYIKKTNKIERTPFTFQTFKKRLINTLNFGTSGLLAKKQQVVEGFIYLKLRQKIKKKLIRKKKQYRAPNAKFNYWVRYTPNTYFTKKSKNARMGSGKGKFVRKAYTLPANSVFIEFRMINVVWFNTFLNFFYTKYNLYLIPFKLKKVNLNYLKEY